MTENFKAKEDLRKARLKAANKSRIAVMIQDAFSMKKPKNSLNDLKPI